MTAYLEREIRCLMTFGQSLVSSGLSLRADLVKGTQVSVNIAGTVRSEIPQVGITDLAAQQFACSAWSAARLEVHRHMT
jgi:hypothetical protein